MLALQLLPFLLVAALAAFAVLSHCFDDNLLQRIGLSGICIGATLTAFVLMRGQIYSHGTCVVFAYGVAVYGIGTFIKAHGFRKS